MTAVQIRQLTILSRQLTENLMSAAICAKEISLITQSLADASSRHSTVADDNGRRLNKAPAVIRPLLDEAALSVIWRGKTLHLGHSKGFWLLARLARRTNQYVTHLDLLREIWDDEFADAQLLRAGMKRLRNRLRQGGMADLAEALIGHHGRYMLDLARIKGHRQVTAMSHRASQA